MSFERSLSSPDRKEIKQALIKLLDDKKVTTQDVLDTDKAFEALTEEKDKHAFLAEFESRDGTPPKRSPALLERWTHYRWIRTELMSLINQRAAFNQKTIMENNLAEEEKKIAAAAKRLTPAQAKMMSFSDFQASITESTLTIPAMMDSIEEVIREEAFNRVPITESIEILKKMSLQLIATEHPTDPLSQKARLSLLKVANLMSEKHPNEEAIQAELITLQATDAIPANRRTVEEEVNRNIDFALEKLYDNVPALVQSILGAYQKYYGENAYAQHKAAILSAMETLIRDGSWAGFDAEGNKNVTPKATSRALRLHRIRASEKHITTLKNKVVKAAKKIERDLRKTISDLNSKSFRLFLETGPTKSQILDFYQFHNRASQFMIDRNFKELIPTYMHMLQTIQTTDKPNVSAIQDLLNKQLEAAKTLAALTRFSGSFKKDQDELEHGDIQKLQKLFTQYKRTIRDDSNEIKLKNEKGESRPAAEVAIDHLNKILAEHKPLLDQYPDLDMQMRVFGIQLHSYGVTLGRGHVRQDSSVFVNVWDTIFTDLQNDPVFAKHPIIALLNKQSYKTHYNKNNAICVALHKQLQDGSKESKILLEAISDHFENDVYKEKRKKDEKFNAVQTELHRIKLMVHHEDAIENLIISNCKSAADILGAESLQHIFCQNPRELSIITVPLFESQKDLANFKEILREPLLFRKQQQPGRKIIAEIMKGYSDTEREVGPSGLGPIKKMEEDYFEFCQELEVEPKIFHGGGTCTNRGGMKRHDAKMTGQGIWRPTVLNIDESALWFRKKQFSEAYRLIANPDQRMEFNTLSEPLQKTLESFIDWGIGLYKNLHEEEEGFGKGFAAILGQSTSWISTLLNSSSRASQRGSEDKSGDRTKAVQTGGKRPVGYFDIPNSRAITASQTKGFRFQLGHIGPGFALRKIKRDKALQVYPVSETMRDIVEKDLMAAALRDLSFLKHTLFADLPDCLPKNRYERDCWAGECNEAYIEKFKSLNVPEMLKKDDTKKELFILLSKLVAYIEVECEQTMEFLFVLNHQLHGSMIPNGKRESTDLLSHAPAWKEQTKELLTETESSQYIIARLSHHVARGKNLNEIYPGLNDQPMPDSQLKGVGRVIGNVGAAAIDALPMQPGFTENFYHDYRAVPRHGVKRAKKETAFCQFFDADAKQKAISTTKAVAELRTSKTK